MPNKAVRRMVGLIAAASLLVALFVWPHSRIGWIVQIVSVVVGFACLGVLRKWSSA
jgi:asparagine N-glycosylation enzyme membrane subunit Stt3